MYVRRFSAGPLARDQALVLRRGRVRRDGGWLLRDGTASFDFGATSKWIAGEAVRPSGNYVLGSVATSIAIATLLLPWLQGVEASRLNWALVGWLLAVVSGAAAGAWLSGVHGQVGTAFLLRSGLGLAGRTAAYAGGATVAWLVRGEEAVWPFVAGAAAGYLPTQAFEMVWFARRTKRDHVTSVVAISRGIGGER